jgi:hypothetical protein
VIGQLGQQPLQLVGSLAAKLSVVQLNLIGTRDATS